MVVLWEPVGCCARGGCVGIVVVGVVAGVKVRVLAEVECSFLVWSERFVLEFVEEGERRNVEWIGSGKPNCNGAGVVG
eukprot:12876103-Alexandrium_andersonii.AAC.1